MKKRLLFIYPNMNTELRIPLAISIMAGCIRREGHEFKLFDTTFMVEKLETDDEKMASMGTHLPTNLAEMAGELKKVDIEKELLGVIAQFKPHVVAVSLLERNIPVARRFCGLIKKQFPEIIILVGGIMPTISPEYVLGEEWADYVCLGEGEEAIVEFLSKAPDKEALGKVPNIWFKDSSGAVVRNPLRPLVNMDTIPEQDWTDFDQRHLLKPFMGKVYRGGPFEFSRGCSKICAFCVAPQLRNAQKGLGKYHRTKDPVRAITEIANKVKAYQLNMLSFGDTDFLNSVPKPVMKKFLELYIERVGVPFTMQSSAETLVDDEILALLRQARCCAISVGVESGSARVRKEIIHKHVSKEVIKRGFDLCRKHELRITSNYMIGLPNETEEDVWETIKFNRELDPPSIAVMYFTPFVGTELFDVSVKAGFYDPSHIATNNYSETPLNMPQLPAEKIYDLIKVFIADFKTYQRDFNILS